MKALIRKRPINAYEWQSDEVWFEPWINADEIGRPYTLEGYRYALCMNVPDGEIVENDPRLDAANYEITEHIVNGGTEEEPDETFHHIWMATYTGH